MDDTDYVLGRASAEYDRAVGAQAMNRGPASLQHGLRVSSRLEGR